MVGFTRDSDTGRSSCSGSVNPYGLVETIRPVFEPCFGQSLRDLDEVRIDYLWV